MTADRPFALDEDPWIEELGADALATATIRSEVADARERFGPGPTPALSAGKHLITGSTTAIEVLALRSYLADAAVIAVVSSRRSLALSYPRPDGSLATFVHVPDFLVIETGWVGWDEWLAEPLGRRPRRSEPYVRVAGRVRCPPGEAAARELGLGYRVRTLDDLIGPAPRRRRDRSSPMGRSQERPARS